MPKPRQVYLVLRERIADGGFDTGGVLPPEQALAAAHNVSRITVRRAPAELSREGLIDRRQGAGTFVNPREVAKPVIADLAEVLHNLIEMGKSTDVRSLAFGCQEAAAPIEDILSLAPGERVQRSVRVRLIDGAPFSHLTIHVPERIGMTYSEPELASQPLLTLLERSGVSVDRARQEIGAVLASPEVASALDLDIGSALIALARVAYDARGRGVEHLRALYRPDRHAFRMDLQRTGGRDGRRWSPVAKSHDEIRAKPASRARAPSSRKAKGKTS